MMTRRSAFSVLAGGAFALTACADALKPLSGTVTYRERMALPAGAVLVVRLEDVSLADAPAKILAESTQSIQGAPPLSYILHVPVLESHRRYNLHAEIRVGEQLLFTTEEAHSPSEPDIVVTRVAAPANDLPYGSWTVQSLNGEAIPDTVRAPTLTLARDGHVFGSGGCNRLMGQAVITANSLQFKPFAMTRMACIGSGMETEDAFVKALDKVRAWSTDQKGNLVFQSESMKPVVVLQPENISEKQK
ncbi:META domain-containing protein [Gluconobacter frateurii]|uniref:META domain-containing protein n=1 Tax=Gluconobacter frateurii TaxID=38308 RepID=UPI001F0570C7|nr:META domain-containing protein [Gluconobacter frateurii]UMM07475.1 META domain-containing protein [Gluconobacter frateurii]